MRIVFLGLLSVALLLGCSRSDGESERGKAEMQTLESDSTQTQLMQARNCTLEEWGWLCPEGTQMPRGYVRHNVPRPMVRTDSCISISSEKERARCLCNGSKTNILTLPSGNKFACADFL